MEKNKRKWYVERRNKDLRHVHLKRFKNVFGKCAFSVLEQHEKKDDWFIMNCLRISVANEFSLASESRATPNLLP